MQGQVDPDYLTAASYLSEVGFTNKTEIARVLDVAMNPNSLFVQASVNASARPLTVDADMKPVVEYLQSQGVKAGDIVKVSLSINQVSGNHNGPATSSCHPLTGKCIMPGSGFCQRSGLGRRYKLLCLAVFSRSQ